MKRQLSSIDLHYLVKELREIEGSRIDKIYHPEKNVLVFSFYKTNAGKKLLKVNVGQSIFLADEKENYDELLGFGMLLRKHLDGYFLEGIEQIKPERILRLSFKVKEDRKHLYLEFFGKGNAILCDSHDVIINALEHHEFRERSVKPRLKYVYPVMGCNLFELEENKLTELLKNSKKDTLVISLATELGLGGLYSEEVCLLSNIDKNTSQKDIDEKKITLILDSIKKIINKKISPSVVLDENNAVIDFIPFDVRNYDNKGKKEFSSFSEAVSYFYSQFREVKETEFDRKISELSRIIEEQKQKIGELKKEEKELREKGELFYHNYNTIKDILDEINKASKKYSWKEIKEKLKGHKTVKEINEKEKKVVVEIE